ncbi:BamA/TamA family outer membrane protein [Maribacter polysiphoniae]|uniref:BamA/TamA family outer membrane protein n=1 Tax=Maribacter polysiphoniae TaxID=429344 RepID=UPI002353037B|nr:BamA/TamA family outer membrane protein [Maribacter polysiphoniae]
MKNVNGIFLILLLSVVLTVDAQVSTDSTVYKTKITPLPNIGYSPDTRLVLGAFMLAQFKPKKSDLETRPSNLMASAAFTFEKQTSIETYYNIVFPKEKWLWNGAVYFQRWPIRYWGVGPNTKDDDEITIDYRNIAFEQSLYRNINNGFYIGPKVHFRSMYDINLKNVDDGKPLDISDIPGGEGGTNIGIGFGGTWDKRNSILTPTENHFVEFSALFYAKNWLSDFSFQTYTLDVRKYFDFDTHGKRVLAFQFFSKLNIGEVPFQDMSLLGGNKIMRGYMEGRFRDKVGLQIQTEYRQFIKGRFGMVLFAATGNIAPKLGDITFSQAKWTLGTGLRYNINKADSTFIRVDFGFGKDTSGFYLTLGEAF